MKYAIAQFSDKRKKYRIFDEKEDEYGLTDEVVFFYKDKFSCEVLAPTP